MKYSKMPFGKYKGVLIPELPTNYLVYSIESFELPDELMQEFKREVLIRINLLEPDFNAGYVNDFINYEYKSICKKHHPDKGGTNEAMQAVNEFKTLLNKI